MGHNEAKDAGGLTPVKDDNEAAPHFTHRTLLFFNCFDYIKKNFHFEPIPVAIPGFLPGNDIALLIEEQYQI